MYTSLLSYYLFCWCLAAVSIISSFLLWGSEKECENMRSAYLGEGGILYVVCTIECAIHTLHSGRFFIIIFLSYANHSAAGISSYVLTKIVNESISFWLDLMDCMWFSFRLLLICTTFFPTYFFESYVRRFGSIFFRLLKILEFANLYTVSFLSWKIYYNHWVSFVRIILSPLKSLC